MKWIMPLSLLPVTCIICAWHLAHMHHEYWWAFFLLGILTSMRQVGNGKNGEQKKP